MIPKELNQIYCAEFSYIDFPSNDQILTFVNQITSPISKFYHDKVRLFEIIFTYRLEITSITYIDFENKTLYRATVIEDRKERCL